MILSNRRIRVKRLQREQALTADTERALTGDRDVSARLTRDPEKAIARLPERARTVLVLHDIEGYRHKEIAADVKVSVENIAGSIVIQGWDKNEVQLTGELGDSVEELKTNVSQSISPVIYQRLRDRVKIGRAHV